MKSNQIANINTKIKLFYDQIKIKIFDTKIEFFIRVKLQIQIFIIKIKLFYEDEPGYKYLNIKINL